MGWVRLPRHRNRDSNSTRALSLFQGSRGIYWSHYSKFRINIKINLYFKFALWRVKLNLIAKCEFEKFNFHLNLHATFITSCYLTVFSHYTQLHFTYRLIEVIVSSCSNILNLLTYCSVLRCISSPIWFTPGRLLYPPAPLAPPAFSFSIFCFLRSRRTSALESTCTSTKSIEVLINEENWKGKVVVVVVAIKNDRKYMGWVRDILERISLIRRSC